MPTPSEIQTCINNLTTSSEPIDFTLLAAETSNANTGISFSVATVDDLPDLETTNIGTGQIVFVESIGVPVVSTENEWKGLDGRLLRRDFIVNALFSWGLNEFGQLGIGNVVAICSPVREIGFGSNWCQVSGERFHSAAVKTSGELWAWGNNNCGRLGDGTITSSCSPVREFCSATDWCQVDAGNIHTTAIKTSGELWAWGLGICGVLGDGTTIQRCSPVREFCSATDWCQVSTGGRLTLAIKTSGELWGWGNNNCGQIGNGIASSVSLCSPVREISSSTDWCGVSSGYRHSAGLKTSGELWSWGSNQCGRLGDGTTVTRCSPVREFCSATDWCQVSSGGGAIFSIKTSGELWGWGRNACGIVGDGTITDRCSPVREFCSATNWCQVSAGGYHTVAIKTSGELWSWGSGSCGVLGDGTVTNRCSPVREFCSATDWCSAGTSGFQRHTTAIRIIT